MYKAIDKVLIEYVFTMLKDDRKLKGRLSERMGGDPAVKYTMAVSHYYRLAAQAPELLRPTKTDFLTREEAERALYAYVRGYTGIGLEPNPDY